jgi:hypothetical protein
MCVRPIGFAHVQMTALFIHVKPIDM